MEWNKAIALILNVVGVLAFLVGISAGVINENFMITAYCALSGLFMFGFAAIINLLYVLAVEAKKQRQEKEIEKIDNIGK